MIHSTRSSEVAAVVTDRRSAALFEFCPRQNRRQSIWVLRLVGVDEDDGGWTRRRRTRGRHWTDDDVTSGTATLQQTSEKDADGPRRKRATGRTDEHLRGILGARDRVGTANAVKGGDRRRHQTECL